MAHFFTLTLLLTTTFFAAFAHAAPKSELWAYWDQSDERSTQTLSHQAWQSFLDDYLVTQGENTLVRYDQVTKSDQQALNTYLETLAAIDPRALNRAEQYAYWVNLYNAITLDLIVENYPIESITKLGGFFRFGPWQDDAITIAGKTLTLNDIEHRILRPIWNDPRTHYAVNCASLGCPNLQLQAFTAANTETLLESAAKSFIHSEKGVSLSSGKATLSSIYEWFADDFAKDGGIIKHIAKYRPELANFSGEIRYNYDWGLNQIK